MLGIPVVRGQVIETTALGAAYLAGLAVGFWTMDDIGEKWQLDQAFNSDMEDEERDRLYAGWQKAVERTMGWEKA